MIKLKLFIELAVRSGGEWIPVRGLALPGLPEVFYWGLAVCSHDNKILTEARFRRVLQRRVP